jgi:hypothetical protein
MNLRHDEVGIFEGELNKGFTGIDSSDIGDQLGSPSRDELGVIPLRRKRSPFILNAQLPTSRKA